VVVLIGAATVAGVVLTATTKDLTWLFLSLPFWLLLLVFARYAPSGYCLTRDGVHIERKAGPAVIPYARIRAVDRLPRPVTGLAFAASNGLFGRFGRFWSLRLGFFRLFLANTQDVVWLTTDDGLVGLSPDRPDAFIERLALRVTTRPGI
jgi:hypothetical protein